MSYANIVTDDQLQQYCRQLAGAKSISLDTEFVSEHTYRPVLCLVQVLADGQPALIDAMTIDDITPFWEALASPGHETIVHSGRSEVEFCLRSVGRLPAGLFDVQLAAGLAGVEYPANYGALISKLLNESPAKHETRTDWRRRPLSDRQIQYALDDVNYLPPLRETIVGRLEKLGRLDWLRQEMDAWQNEVERAVTRERWRRVSGNSGLNARSLAVLRELWRWREAEAERRDKPVRRVLRDDLLVELAKRRTADPERIGAVRGLERGDIKRRLPEIAAHIQRALDLPEQECPQKKQAERTQQLPVLGQFLFAALSSICREVQLAPALVGTPSDVRDLIAYRTAEPGRHRDNPPRLSQGWRAEVVGRLFEDLLSGKVSVRIGDATSKSPLLFEPPRPV